MSSFGTFNTGHDVAIEIVDPATGVPLLIPIKTGWEKKQRTEQVKSKPLNAPPIFEEDPDGWEGSFDIDRSNSVVDDFFAAREEQFYGARPSGRRPSWRPCRRSAAASPSGATPASR